MNISEGLLVRKPYKYYYFVIEGASTTKVIAPRRSKSKVKAPKDIFNFTGRALLLAALPERAIIMIDLILQSENI